MMTLDRVRKEIHAIADELQLTEPEIVVEQSGRWIHILFASKDFQGKTTGERENLIWRGFEKRLDDETILAITQCYLLTPEEHQQVASMR